MIKLHYAPLVLDGDIPCYEFENAVQLHFHLLQILKEGIVYLVATEDDIYVSEHNGTIQEFFKQRCPRFLFTEIEKEECHELVDKEESRVVVFYLQEYASYEEAYEVALDMKETSPLCYPKD